MKKLCIAVCGVLCLWSGRSFGFSGEVVVGGNASMPRISIAGASVPSTMGIDFGAGALFYFPLAEKSRLSMEFGVLYMGRRYTATPVATVTEYTWKMVEVPIDFRILLTGGLELLMGGYVAFASGNITTSIPQGNGSFVVSNSVSALNYNALDYGFVTGLGYSLALTNKANLVFDLRYLYGAAPYDKAAVNEGFHQNIEFLSGVRFNI